MVEYVLTTGHIVVVDDDDLPLLRKYRWCAARHKYTTYVRTNAVIEGKRGCYLHQILMPGYPEVDHWDGNGLNNRRSNLRGCTTADNSKNKRKTKGSSKYKGVSWDSRRSVWQAHIKINEASHYLGTFDEEIDAAIAYDEKARLHFGQFARTNFDMPSMLEEAASQMLIQSKRCAWKERLVQLFEIEEKLTAKQIAEVIKCDPKHVTARLSCANFGVRPAGSIPHSKAKLYEMTEVRL